MQQALDALVPLGLLSMKTLTNATITCSYSEELISSSFDGVYCYV